jgi:uncharacterized membrane protein
MRRGNSWQAASFLEGVRIWVAVSALCAASARWRQAHAAAWGTAVSWNAFAAFRIVNKLNGFEHISHGTTPNPLFI